MDDGTPVGAGIRRLPTQSNSLDVALLPVSEYTTRHTFSGSVLRNA